MKSSISIRMLSAFYKAVVDLQIVKMNVHLLSGYYSVPIRQVELEIEYYIIKSSISTRTLSGFYKGVVDLQIDKMIVHLLSDPTRFLSGKWSQKLNIISQKVRFLPGRYPVSISQFSSSKFLR